MSEEFYAVYQKVKMAYNQEQYETALGYLQKIKRQYNIPVGKEWVYHQAMAMSLFWLNEVEESIRHFQAAWQNPGDMEKAALCSLYSNYLMYLHYLPRIEAEAMYREHCRYQDFFEDVVPFSHAKKYKSKLRIGYLSPNITDHIVMNFVVQLFAQCNHERYEVVIYDNGHKKNEVTQWLAGMVNGYRDISRLDARQAAKCIYQDEVDILFDLAGHSEGGHSLQIAAYKPAPVQISGIGYFDTTGLKAMDYFLSDRYCDPLENDAWFREKLIRLPQSHLNYTPSERFHSFRKNYQLHNPVVFGSFNNFAKITDEMLLLWKKILERLPTSRLLLKNVSLLTEPLLRMKKRLALLEMPLDRISIMPATADYLDDYMNIDIALDTYPYPGGGTTCEALYLGIPVINMRGKRHGARFGYSLLKNIGLEELAADSAEDYVNKAAAVAEDRELLFALHQNIRKMMEQSSIMDGKSYVRTMENVYEQIWNTWLKS